jgi:hypothetical protein
MLSQFKNTVVRCGQGMANEEEEEEDKRQYSLLTLSGFK